MWSALELRNIGLVGCHDTLRTLSLCSVHVAATRRSQLSSDVSDTVPSNDAERIHCPHGDICRAKARGVKYVSPQCGLRCQVSGLRREDLQEQRTCELLH